MTVVGDLRFNGPTNLVSVTLVNAVLAGLILRSIYGRKKDPYEASEDRIERTIGEIRFALWTSIVVTLFVALAVALRVLDLSEFEPASMSAYLQLVALLVFSRFSASRAWTSRSTEATPSHHSKRAAIMKAL